MSNTLWEWGCMVLFRSRNSMRFRIFCDFSCWFVGIASAKLKWWKLASSTPTNPRVRQLLLQRKKNQLLNLSHLFWEKKNYLRAKPKTNWWGSLQGSWGDVQVPTIQKSTIYVRRPLAKSPNLEGKTRLKLFSLNRAR